ncbi:MAG: hypothetical protein CMH83_20995 [Nocardioides sp.]|nr:hypothetical protein [Nocardioides sp.]
MTDPDNVLREKNRHGSTSRRCRECRRESQRRYQAKQPSKAKFPRPTGDGCTVEGCTRKRHESGGVRSRYCSAHRRRVEKLGDLYEDIPPSAVKGRTSLAKQRAAQQST